MGLIEAVLKAYNFGTDFRDCFSILNKNSCSCAINNGLFTDFFKLKGCADKEIH